MISEEVEHLPLIIACGFSKKEDDKKHHAYDLYTKGLWQQFRKSSPSLPNKDHDVYVLSAKFGIIPHDKMIARYDKQIISDSKRKIEEGQVRVSDIAQKISKQWGSKPKKILFVGGKAYKEALEKAGFDTIPVENLDDFPQKDIRAGSGRQRGAIKWYLTRLNNNDKNIIRNLPNRFGI